MTRIKRIKKNNYWHHSRNSLTHLLFFFFLFSFFSCQSVSKTPDAILDGHIPLESGAYVYLLAEKDALPVLNQLILSNINNIHFQQMVDQTRFAVAAVYVAPNEESGELASRYRLAAWGNYPAFRAKMALRTSKEWKKRRSSLSGADYWYSPQNGYAVAVTGGVALVATYDTNEEPPDPFSAAPGTELPEGFAAFRDGSLLSCWLANPGPAINLKLMEMRIPLELPAEQLFVSLFPADLKRYAAHLQIRVANAAQARALTMVFAIARNFIPPQTDANSPAALLPAVLFANPPVQDGNNLNITSAPLTAQEIALLLKMFSL